MFNAAHLSPSYSRGLGKKARTPGQTARALRAWALPGPLRSSQRGLWVCEPHHGPWADFVLGASPRRVPLLKHLSWFPLTLLSGPLHPPASEEALPLPGSSDFPILGGRASVAPPGRACSVGWCACLPGCFPEPGRPSFLLPSGSVPLEAAGCSRKFTGCAVCNLGSGSLLHLS